MTCLVCLDSHYISTYGTERRDKGCPRGEGEVKDGCQALKEEMGPRQTRGQGTSQAERRTCRSRKGRSSA